MVTTLTTTWSKCCQYVVKTQKSGAERLPINFRKSRKNLEFTCFCSLFNANCNSNCSTNHWVVTHSDKSHHLNVSWYGRRSCELCIRVHTSHCICHTVGSWTCCHVIWVKCTSCTTTGSYGEVFLSCF